VNQNILKKLIGLEESRQQNTISLIASENCSSDEVRNAQGSRLTDKYAEGYPGKRYYNGCKIVDEIEKEAIKNACDIFGCNYANVQPHSGSQANEAIFLAFLNPGDRILGLALSHGGHLTHGFKSSMSGKIYDAHFYTTDENSLIDMQQVRKIALETKPKLIIAGASSYSRIIDWKKFRSIADESGAYLLADVAHYSGLIAGGSYPNPFPHAHFATSSTHKTLRGPRGGLILWNDQDFCKKIDSAVFPGVQGGPLMHVIAAKAIAFAEAKEESFKEYTKQVVTNAQLFADLAMQNGWKVLSDGTDCHMLVFELYGSGLTGIEAENLLLESGIIVSRNILPTDPAGSKGSGIRIGTASITSRGMKEKEVTTIFDIINDILKNKCNKKKDVELLCKNYPLRK
jgi:glycine hydroxymethyltransferase